MILLELDRIWKKRVFIIMIATSLLIQIFSLWYNDTYISDSVPLSSHKLLNTHLSKLTETGKGSYLSKEKELMDAMLFEEKSNMYLNENTELGEKYIQQVLNDKMDYYNKYLETYTSGSYLRYTKSLDQETTLIERNLNDYNKVNGYSDYISKTVNSTLGEISVFSSNADSSSSFSMKNIEKSARDHMEFKNLQLKYMDTGGIVEAFRFSVADMFIVLLTVYFAIQLIWEEKETGLYAVTRSTKKGRLHSIRAKLCALFLHVFVMSLLFFTVRFLWYGIRAGFIDMTLPIQSAAAYLESSIHFNFIQMAAAVLCAKVLGAYVLGMFVLLAAQKAKSVWVPWLYLGIWTAVNAALYLLIDVHTKVAMLKFLSFFSLFNGDKIFGEYLNVNLLGMPVSSGSVSIVFSLILLAVLTVWNLIYYVLAYNGEISTRKRKAVKAKIMDKTVWGHELYKIMVMNNGIVILIIFAIVTGYFQYSTQYKVSSGEAYYQEFMLQLEGKLDDEKEELITKEQKKFDDATAQIEKIDRLLGEGTIDDSKADEMKIKYEMILSYYPQFEKVLYHYDRAVSEGTEFLYDTGYREAFWMNGNTDRLLRDLLMAAASIILIFGSTFSMEQERKSWMLIGTTSTGSKRIKRRKAAIALSISAIMSIYSTAFRLLMINRALPINRILFSSRTIMGYNSTDVSLLVLILVLVALNILVYCSMAMAVTWISSVREKTNEVYFFSVLFLIIPLCMLLLI